MENHSDLITIESNYNLLNLAYTIFENIDLTENTKNEYLSRIGIFTGFVRENGFNRDAFLKYKRHLASKSEYSISTKNKYLASARIFLKELNRVGILKADITQNVKSFPQIKKHKKNGFTESEIARIVEYLKAQTETQRIVRLKALFSLLALQGLRQIEIIRLDVEDLDLKNGTANVQGKGQIDKEVIYLHPHAITHLKKHLKANKISSGPLFSQLRKRKEQRITTMTIKREIGRLTSELGIHKTVHGFRHYFITTLLNKMDVRDVRKFSRHKNLEMLIVYDDEIELKEKSQEVFATFSKINF